MQIRCRPHAFHYKAIDDRSLANAALYELGIPYLNAICSTSRPLGEEPWYNWQDSCEACGMAVRSLEGSLPSGLGPRVLAIAPCRRGDFGPGVASYSQPARLRTVETRVGV